MQTEKEIRNMIVKLEGFELRAQQTSKHYLKDQYRQAYEVLSWVLGEYPEEEVILFGE